MKAAPLECPDCCGMDHVRPCVRSLACWWKEVRELEEILGYGQSSLRARDVWDELIAWEVPSPQPSLYMELRATAEVWARTPRARRSIYPSLLDQFVMTSEAEDLELPSYAVLVAFRLRQRLCGI